MVSRNAGDPDVTARGGNPIPDRTISRPHMAGQNGAENLWSTTVEGFLGQRRYLLV